MLLSPHMGRPKVFLSNVNDFVQIYDRFCSELGANFQACSKITLFRNKKMISRTTNMSFTKIGSISPLYMCTK